MKNILISILAISVFCATALAADNGSPTFIKVGKSYFLHLPPSEATNPAYCGRITVIASGGGGWFLIEYKDPAQKRSDGTTVPAKKLQTWLNFGLILAAEEVQ